MSADSLPYSVTLVAFNTAPELKSAKFKDFSFWLKCIINVLLS